jgi:hypothetical protein
MAETLPATVPSENPAPGRSQRHLRNYLLNSRYQLKFTLTIVGISLVLTGLLGYFVISKAHEASRVVAVRALDPGDTLAQELAAQFARNDRLILLVLILFGALLAVVLAGYGIVLTHKVAGPLYKLAMYFDRIRDGHLGSLTNLRKGDELVDFFEHFKQAHDALRKRTEEDIALLEKAIEAVGAAPLAEDLKAAKARKLESLA